MAANVLNNERAAQARAAKAFPGVDLRRMMDELAYGSLARDHNHILFELNPTQS
jgi:hypothetical protein